MSEKQPSYKLIYFDSRSRAEHIRYIFAYAGIDYVEESVPKERWPEMNESFVKIGIAMAHARHWKDSTLKEVRGFTRKLHYIQYELDLFKKEEKKWKLLSETIPFYFNKFEQTVSKNGSYTVGSTTTWADFVFALALEKFQYIFGVTVLAKYPSLRALKKRVHEIPAIAAWVAKRPYTEF